MKKVLFSLLLLAFCFNSKAQLFTQNFSGSKTVDDYKLAISPSTGQFNDISADAGGLVRSITGPTGDGALRFVRTAGTGFYMFRNYSFTTNPTFVQFKFDIEISNNASALNLATQLYLYIGKSFTAATAASSTDYSTRIAFNTTANAGDFNISTVDNLGGAPSSGTFSGKQTVTIIINNTGSSQNYTAPDASTEAVANGKADIWIGTTKSINERTLKNYTGSGGLTGDISAFKFQSIASGSGTMTFDWDNIVFTDLLGNSVLPIELKSFMGKETNKSIALNWTTVSEKNNRSFEILRSHDSKSFKAIGSVDGALNSDQELSYSFTDVNPMAGTNYYRLKQNDLDGKSSLSQVVAINSKLEETKIAIYATSTINVTISSPNSTSGKLSLYDTTGKLIEAKSIFLDKGFNSIMFNQNLNKGIYFVTFESENQVHTQKFVK